jgi:hypothetical protein
MTTLIDTTKLDMMIATNPAKLAAEVAKSAFRILAQARIHAPRDPERPPQDPSRQVTGALKANSDIVVARPDGLKMNIEFYQEYAIYQELGAPAINLPARPFLTPAVENEEKAFVEAIKKAIV